tara:strand:- start:613 stop:777 length:165 start_codon:yes stop_codon:yes gene_type:complete
MFEPGKDFQYGIGIDWVGILVEKVTKKPLNEAELIAEAGGDPNPEANIITLCSD